MISEDTRIRQTADKPAASTKPAPQVEWWDAADVYFMENLKEPASDVQEAEARELIEL